MLPRADEAREIQWLTVSTCFTGIGTVELCARALSHDLARKNLALRLRSGMMCEIDRGARAVLHRLTTGSSSPCLSDLLSLWSPVVRRRIATGFSSFEQLVKFLSANSDQLSTTYECAFTGDTHGVDLGDIHCGGNPCTDWSAMGTRKGLSGPTAPVVVTWGLLVRRHRPGFVLQENVPQFPTHILGSLFGTS